MLVKAIILGLSRVSLIGGIGIKLLIKFKRLFLYGHKLKYKMCLILNLIIAKIKILSVKV
jgi:hypothetical protein